jgi:hypothetical protein
MGVLQVDSQNTHIFYIQLYETQILLVNIVLVVCRETLFDRLAKFALQFLMSGEVGLQPTDVLEPELQWVVSTVAI